MSGFLGRQRSRGGGYHRLGRQLTAEEPADGVRRGSDEAKEEEEQRKGASKKGDRYAVDVGAHPVQKVLNARRMDKAMAKPEFVRYIAYLKEAGRWDGVSDHPAIFYD